MIKKDCFAETPRVFFGMIPKKSTSSKQSNEKRTKVLLKQSNSQRIKPESPRPHVGIQWNDVKSGFKHFKIKRWNSIGSWVLKCMCVSDATSIAMLHKRTQDLEETKPKYDVGFRDVTSAHFHIVSQA